MQDVNGHSQRQQHLNWAVLEDGSFSSQIVRPDHAQRKRRGCSARGISCLYGKFKLVQEEPESTSEDKGDV